MGSHRRLAASAALVLLASTTARADSGDTRSRDRTVFYAALAFTGAGLASWFYAGSRVRAAENDLDDIGPAVGEEQGYVDPTGDGMIADVCALAEDGSGPASQEANDICRRGNRWQTVARVSQVVTLGSAVVSAIFAYRAFRSPDSADQAPPPRAAWRAQPIASPNAVGLGVDVAF